MRALGGEEYSMISTRWLTKLFVLVDLGCFITQVAGSIMSGSEDSNEASQGQTTIVVGLIVQILAFIFFATCVLVFHLRMRGSFESVVLTQQLHWPRYLIGLQIVSLIFIIRNIVRIVEFKQGSEGTIQSREVFLYLFDACFMLAIIVLFIVLHPGRLVRNAKRLGKSGFGREDGMLLT
jgi:hypothetical protein